MTEKKDVARRRRVRKGLIDSAMESARLTCEMLTQFEQMPDHEVPSGNDIDVGGAKILLDAVMGRLKSVRAKLP